MLPVGPVTVTLRFACNELDSFVVAALSRVDAQGNRQVLSMGAIRPARRTVDASLSNACEVVIDSGQLTPLVPGEPVALRFSLVPLAARLQRGQKRLLQLASRSDLVRGNIGDGDVQFDFEAPPYFSKNAVHEGADSFIEIDVLDS